MKRARTTDDSTQASPKRKEQKQWLPNTEVWVEIPRRRRSPLSSTSGSSNPVVVARRYILNGDEIDEDDLILAGEAEPDDNFDDSIPIRTLDEYALYEPGTRELLPSSALLVDGLTLQAVGTVHTYTEEGEDSNDEASDDGLKGGQRVLLSPILECSVHWPLRGIGFDSKIYIRTRHAWYILLQSARVYTPFHRVFHWNHRIAHCLFTHLLKNPQLTETDFLALLEQDVSIDQLTSSEFVSYLAMVMEQLAKEDYSLCQQLLDSSLVTRLYPSLSCLTNMPNARPAIDISRSLSPSLPTSLSTTQRQRRKLKDIEKDVLQHADRTVVTPRVGAIAQQLFSQSLCQARMSPDSDYEVLREPPAYSLHAVDPQSIEWVTGTEDPHIFHSVSIDGELYSAGDVVIVESGADTNRSRSRNAASDEAQCYLNDLANRKWFCKINYFYEEKISHQGRKFFHAQWLEHGSKTLLQEAAHSRSLFWINECCDLSVECIYSHCNLQTLSPGQMEPVDDVTGHENKFFAGLTLDAKHHAFVMLSSEDIADALSYCEQLRPCLPCGFSIRQNVKESWTSLPQGGFAHLGVDYHVNDFVYLHNSHSTVGLLDIAQITEFLGVQGDEVCLRVQSYGRYDDSVKRLGGNHLAPRDNRRLFQTQAFFSVKLASVEGKAFVACPISPREKESWIKEDDHFYCDLQAKSLSSVQDIRALQPSGLPQCQQCNAAVFDASLEKEALLNTFHKLRGLELFAGAGGLSTGLEMSGFVETKWAVEFSPSAAKTFQANHPNAVVYNESSNCLLQHAIDAAEGRNPSPLRGKGNNEELPPMPQKGDVEFIYGGPPCQSFSMMNHHRKPDDIRSTLVSNMISFVEFYQPKYFLLENVAGLLSYHLDRQVQGKNTVKRLKMGVVKFNIRALTTLGYQVHFRILQAGQYGAPQGRQRVIFLGARGDVPLPDFPIPQYAYPKPLHNYNLPNQVVLHPTYRVGHGTEGHQCAPLPAVTIDEAIGDLPQFNWKNPHKVYAPTPEDVQKAQNQEAQGIPSFDAVTALKSWTAIKSCHPGFPSPTPYPHPPLARYQMWLRGENASTVDHHYTMRYPAVVVESVCNIPMLSHKHPKPNHEDLPRKLRLKHLKGADSKKKSMSQTIYGRLDGSGQFITAMTTIMPNAKGGRVIHPHQQRVLSIRECARAQGFPDSYHFESTNNEPRAIVADQMRQIGNAVPVPLALALGREIGKSLIKLWKQMQEQEQQARLRSPELE